MQSLYLPLPPVVQKRETERTLENNIRGPTRKAIGDGDPMHENRKIERRVRKRHQEISEVENLERTKNGTNKMRDMSIRPN